MKILIVGCGNMGKSMVEGWLASSNPPSITVVDRHYVNSDLTIHKDISELSRDAEFDLIVIAIKPAYGVECISNISKHLGQGMKSATVMSVMAGGTVSVLEEACGFPEMGVIRVIPNTPCSVEAGAMGVFANKYVSNERKSQCMSLLGAVGTVVEVPKEEDLRAVTAIAGSAVAYVFLLAEILQKRGIDMGLSEEAAATLSRATVWGAGKMLHTSSESAEQLRKNVTSPNGTTAAALSVLMSEENWPQSLKEATESCAKRMAELGG